MNRFNARSMGLDMLRKCAPETTLILMPDPHTTGVEIGKVNFIMNSADDTLQIRRDNKGHLVLRYNDVDYQVKGYGPTDSVKQRCILGPYPRPEDNLI